MNDEIKKSIIAAEKESTFSTAIKNSLLDNSSKNFSNAYDVYARYLMETEAELTHQQIMLKLTKVISKELFKFTRHPKFMQQNVLEYLRVMEDKVTPRLFAFILWVQDKKKACFEIFKHHEVNYTASEYDSAYIVLSAHGANYNLPINIEDRREYMDKQKEEFLFHQNKYKLLVELSDMPNKDEDSIKKKLKV